MSGKAGWYRVTDVRAFLAQRGTRSTAPHDMTGRVLHWPMCRRCGLLGLRNDTTRRLLAKLCTVEE